MRRTPMPSKNPRNLGMMLYRLRRYSSVALVRIRVTQEVFYEIYRKLTVGRSDPQKAFDAIEELSQICRDAPEGTMAHAKNCIHEIANSPSLFVFAAAKWTANRADFGLARALIRDASVRHLNQSTPVMYNLVGLGEAAAIQTGCRLCAFFATPAVSLGWALSLSTSFPDCATVVPAVDHLLEYHVNEFPRTTLKLLSATDSPFPEIDAAVAPLKYLNEAEDTLKNLPRLREFQMTPEMRLSLASLRRGQDRNIHEQANSQSVFRQICKIDRFKYADRISVESEIESEVNETSMTMSSYSVAVEIPVSESTDPVRGAATRRAFMNGISQ